MRKIVFFTLFLFVVTVAWSQDLVVTKNADEIQAKIMEITSGSISYRQWANPDGPVYVVPKSDVLYIKYENGTKEVFSEAERLSMSRKSQITGVRLQSYIYLGSIFMQGAGGVTADLSLGARIYDYGYIGFETGFHVLFSKGYVSAPGYYLYYKLQEGYIPLALNLKGYIPVGKKIYPYVNCSLGGFFGVMDMAGLNGFYCQVGAGIDIKRFSFGIGYSGLVNVATASLGYVKLGIRLGKW